MSVKCLQNCERVFVCTKYRELVVWSCYSWVMFTTKLALSIVVCCELLVYISPLYRTRDVSLIMSQLYSSYRVLYMSYPIKSAYLTVGDSMYSIYVVNVLNDFSQPYDVHSVIWRDVRIALFVLRVIASWYSSGRGNHC